MSKTTRNRYSAGFKAKVALEAIRGELTLSQLGAKHGVHQTMINAWKKQAIDKLCTVFEGKSETGKTREEMRWRAIRSSSRRD
jgi:transposase